MTRPPDVGPGRCLTPAEIATLLSSDSADTPQGAAAHLNACDACQRRMQQWLVGGTRAVTGGAGTADPPAEADAPPEVAGFTFEAVIGVGGMGAVWRAVQHLPNRTVAVKFVRGRKASAEALDRLRREANAAARLQHPNVVTLYEFREDAAAGAFLTLEYVPGGTLADRMAAGPLDPADACRMVRTLAEAVGFANSRGVVHRDLKPTNVLLAEDGTPKVADFGIARVQGGDALGEVAGTPHYMAPEQARGEAVDARADVYALGVILFELVTGQTPFRGDTAAAVLLAAERSDPPRAGRLRKGVPRAVETVCEKCLQRDPDRRYASAHELAADLERFLTGRPIQAMPVSRVARGLMWSRRNKALTAALALGAVLVFVGSPVVTYLWLTAEQARSDAVQSFDDYKREEEARKKSEVKEKAAREFSLLGLKDSPSQEDVGLDGRPVPTSGPNLRPLEERVENLKRYLPHIAGSKEGEAAGWLVFMLEGARAANHGDWAKAESEFQKLADSVAKMADSQDRFDGQETLPLLRVMVLAQLSIVRRNGGRLQPAAEAAEQALAVLDAAGPVWTDLERRRLRRDVLMVRYQAVHALGQNAKLAGIATELIKVCGELADKPGEAEDLAAAGRCFVTLVKQPSPAAGTAANLKYAELGLGYHLQVHRQFPTAIQVAFETGEAYHLAARAALESGDLPKAKAHNQRAREQLEAVAGRREDLPGLTQAVAAALITRSQIAAKDGDRGEAVRAAKAAVETVTRYLDRDTTNPIALSDLAEAHYTLASAMANDGKVREAIESLTTVIKTLSRMPKEARGRPEVSVAMVNARLELAALHSRTGSTPDAQRSAAEALDGIRTRLNGPVLTDSDIFTGLDQIERCFLPTPLLPAATAEEAVRVYQTAVARLAAGRPPNAAVPVFRGYGRLFAAMAEARAGRTEEALLALRQASEEFVRAESVRDEPHLPRVLGRGHFFVARTYQRLGRRFEQVEAERRSIIHRRKWAELRPDDFDAADALAYSLAFLGDALAADGRTDDETAYADAVRLWDSLDERRRTTNVTVTNRVIALAGMAHRRIDQDRFPQAEEALKRAWDLLDSIPEAGRATAEFRTASRLYYHRSAWMRAKTGDHAECESAAKELCAAAKDNPNALLDAADYLAWCRDLAIIDQSLDPADRAKLVERYASAAVHALSQAADAGLTDAAVRSKPRLQRLADRADFRAVLKRLDPKTK